MLMLMILAPLSAAYRMPRATTSSVPKFGAPKMSSQSLSITFTGIIFTLKATPAPCRAVVRQLSDRAADVGAVAVEIQRHVVVPDEIVRRDESPGRGQIGRGRKRDVDLAERRMEMPRSSRNAAPLKRTIALVKAMPVSSTATVIADPAAG